MVIAFDWKWEDYSEKREKKNFRARTTVVINPIRRFKKNH